MPSRKNRANTSSPLLRGNVLTKPGQPGQQITTAELYKFIQEASTFAYQIEADAPLITCRAEERKGSLYWYAFKRQDATTIKKVYLGTHSAVTFERLAKAANELTGIHQAEPPPPALAKPAELWTRARFANATMPDIFKACSQECERRHGYPMKWTGIENSGKQWYALPDRALLGERRYAIDALVRYVNTGRDNAANRRHGQTNSAPTD